MIQHTSDETVVDRIGSHGRSRLVVALLASKTSVTCGGLMTDDHASAEPVYGPDHSASEATDQKQQGSGSRIKKITGTLLKGWRALAFLLIVLIVGSYAFHYKALSDPGSESKQLANHAPQEIDFLVSNRNISMDVNVVAGYPQEPPRSPSAPGLVFVTANFHMPSYVKSATVLMLTNNSTKVSASAPGITESYSSRIENVPPQQGEQPISGYYASTIMISAKGAQSPGAFAIGIFFEKTDLEQTNAYLYGHLPAIGTIDLSLNSPQIYSAVLAESYKNAPYRIRDIALIDFPSPGYSTPYGGPGKVFWPPAKLSITETEPNLAPMIADQQINYMNPTAQVDGQDYVWRGSTYLEPVFQATNEDALQSESNYAFLSGVLFGIAGAAAIAFVQEIPDTFNKPVWWSRRKRKRRSSSQKGTDEKPDSSEDSEGEVNAKTSTETKKSPTGLGWPSSD